MPQSCARLVTLCLLPALVLLTNCLDPTVPEFQLEDAFYLVEGRIIAGEEGSEVRIRESAFTESNKLFNAVEGVTVTSVEAGGTSVVWQQVTGEPGSYRPPADFRAVAGETWNLDVVLPDGTTIVSEAEAVPTAVEVESLDIVFEQNSVFDPGTNAFIPRFELYVNYLDPAGEDNYYAFDYRFWEEVIICATCERGRYRGGECISDLSVMPRFDYYCDSDECFRETAGNEVIFGTDEFSDGLLVSGFQVGGITFNAFDGLLVEGIVMSVSREAFDYGTVIQDLTSGNAGLNATTPAALAGNVRNLDPAGRTVLGFVSVAAAGRARSFVNRTPETGTPVRFDDRIYPEPIVGVFVPPRAPCEGGGRSPERPEGWED